MLYTFFAVHSDKFYLTKNKKLQKILQGDNVRKIVNNNKFV